MPPRYDRHTSTFIGCTLADVSISQVVAIIQAVRIGKTSEVALVRWAAGGPVVASSQWDGTGATTTVNVTSLGIGVDRYPLALP